MNRRSDDIEPVKCKKPGNKSGMRWSCSFRGCMAKFDSYYNLVEHEKTEHGEV